MTLAARLAKLERQPRARASEWRALLAECFTGPEYDAVREDLIAALCSENPAYTFTGPHPDNRPGELALYHVSWSARSDRTAEPGQPLARVYPSVFVLPVPEDEPPEALV